MGKLLLWVLAVFGAASALAGAFGAIVYYGGFIDVSADTPHEAIVFKFIEDARERAIARRVRDITPPADLSDPERVGRGAGNYQAMCVDCHLAPGMPNSEIRRGLYPTPPDLTKSPIERESTNVAARRFWIIKHGIKASAMPAWSKGGIEDSAIWDLTAFLGRLPALTPEQYQDMVAASEGHSHSGLVEMGHDAPPGHVDKPGSKPHTH
ncbi:MAG: cytochrome c [Burkholderiales bacterium]|nr:cytochrome c [Burkholderiales bacterium]